MPIICLEGPSAVGKTTTARLLASQYGAAHIPEVHFLFQRPADAKPIWYLERQAERYQIALERSHHNALVIVDGDPFQAAWYNRIYPEANGSYAEVVDFYRTRLEQNTLALPDKYVFFTTTADELWKRKLNDPDRRRGNFEKHLALVDFLEQYSVQLEKIAPNLVVHHVADSLEANVQAVLGAAKNLEVRTNDLEVFDQSINWLLSIKAE
jgi:nicotinamide riboside kinase